MGNIKLRQYRYPDVTDLEHVQETLNTYRRMERVLKRRENRKQYYRENRKQYYRERYMKKVGLIK